MSEEEELIISEEEEASDASEYVREIVKRMAANDPTVCGSVFLSESDLTDAHAAEVGAALRSNTRVTDLYLNGNDIGDDGARVLAEALCGNSSLVELNLRGNNLGDDGATALAEALSGNYSLMDLDLSMNHVGDDGARAFAGMLARNPPLAALNLWGNDFREDGFSALAGALSSNDSLTDLHVYWRSNNEREIKAEIGRLLQLNRKEKKLTQLWMGTDLPSFTFPVLLHAAGRVSNLRGMYRLLREKPDILQAPSNCTSGGQRRSRKRKTRGWRTEFLRQELRLLKFLDGPVA